MRRNLVIAATALVSAVAWMSTTSASLLDWIFADSFESGDASAWSSAIGPYLVIPDAASEGAFGLRVPAFVGEPVWVQDETLSDESVIRTDFDLNADNIVMTDGAAFDVYVGWVQENTFAAFLLSLGQENGMLGLSITAFDITSASVTSPFIPLPGTGWHRIGIEFGAATGPGNTGEARLFVNGVLEAELGDFDNDGILVKSARLGVAGGVDPGTSGSIDVDVYTSVRLFDPWPCTFSSGGNPTNANPACLDGEGRATAVAVGGCGDGVVAWRGSEALGIGDATRSRLGGIYGKKVSGASGRGFDPTFVIAQDERAVTPDVAMDAECHSVVAWSSDLEIPAVFAGVFDLDGTPLTLTAMVAGGADAEELPSVGADDTGRFLVAWRRVLRTDDAVWGRHYQADATPTAAEFRIDLDTGEVGRPSVAMNGHGQAVVAWASGDTIMGLLVDDGGIGLNHVLLSGGPGDDEPSVGMAADGSFVAVWTRRAADRRVYMRLFDSAGDPLSGEIRVDTLSPADCSEPMVAVDPSGAFTVVWVSLFDDLHTVRGRRFTAEGEPDGSEFAVESAGAVWLPRRPDVAIAERLLFSFSEQTELFGYARGSLVGAFTIPDIFYDGFESGDTGAWSSSAP